MTIPSDACGIEKWSDFFPVCGKIVVKRKITAKLAVIFLKNGGPNRDRTDDLTDANRTLSQLSYRPIVTYAVNYMETGENTYSKSTCCIITDFFKK